MRLDAPFVLIDGAAPRLYSAPARIVRADRAEDMADAIVDLRAAVKDGADVAGFLAYEAGTAIEPRLAHLTRGDGPLLWFGIFDTVELLSPGDVAALLPDPAGAWVGAARPSITREDYDAVFARVQDLIAGGDIYQANLTFPADVPVTGDPLAIYAQLRQRAQAGHGALVWTGDAWLLSCSPESFFSLRDGTLTARPMKGTARRGEDAAADARAVAGLADDPKQRAENLMIVDLMRNDLSRVAAPGSVATPALFEIETYPSVHQMTSTVTATLAPSHDAIDVLTTLFPCGSITGAPKIRAMEVIAEVEASPRGPYTGSIGWIGGGDAAFNVAIRTLHLPAGGGDAAFNVAIRTLHLPAGADTARLGLGSGIVADSAVDAEWDECLAKSAFLTTGARTFDLIETMAFDPEAGLPLLERHLTRMKASADRFGFAFDRHGARNELQAATFRLRDVARVRLLLAASGAIAVEVGPMPFPLEQAAVAIVPAQVAPHDFRLRHKTSDRAFYDDARRAAGSFEVAFEDADGFLTEGSFTSLFVHRGDTLVTPPLARGLLPGVLREELIATGRAIEGDLTRADLANGFFIGNALRGLIPAVLTVAKSDAPAL